MPDFTVATRASALARAQTGWVRDRLADLLGIEVAELLVTSEGDVSDAALTSFGGQGVFVARVREAVLDGRADVAVHSMKDLPTLPHPGTAIAAVPTREDVRDFLVTTRGGLDDLPSGASVGTGSPRRVAYLRRRRPDLRVVAIRGNVDTRVARVKDGDLDAVVVATAGLIRLGLTPPGRRWPSTTCCRRWDRVPWLWRCAPMTPACLASGASMMPGPGPRSSQNAPCSPDLGQDVARPWGQLPPRRTTDWTYGRLCCPWTAHRCTNARRTGRCPMPKVSGDGPLTS